MSETFEEYLKRKKITLLSTAAIAFLVILFLPIGLFMWFYGSRMKRAAQTEFNKRKNELLKKIEKLQNLESKEKEVFEQKEKARKSDETLQHEDNLKKYEEKVKNWKKDIENKKKNHKIQEEKRISWFKGAEEGNTNNLLELLELAFPLKYEIQEDYKQEDPSDIEVGYQIKNGVLQLALVLNTDFDYIPEEGLKMKPSGNGVSVLKISSKIKIEMLNSLICSFALSYA